MSVPERIVLADGALEAIARGEPLFEHVIRRVHQDDKGATVEADCDAWLYIADALYEGSQSQSKYRRQYKLMYEVLCELLSITKVEPNDDHEAV